MIEITFSRLTTTNLGTLGDRTIAYSDQTSDADITGHPLLAEVKTKSEVYNAVILKRIYSGMGTTVEGADLVRDNNHRSLKNILSGFAGFGGTAKGTAAAALLQVFANMGSIYELSYADESAVIDKLLTALTLPTNEAYITTLGLQSEVEALSVAQTNFESLYLEQAAANAELRKQPSASSIRHELEGALRDYYAFVSSMRNIAPWDDLYLVLLELTKAAKSSIREFAPKKESGS